MLKVDNLVRVPSYFVNKQNTVRDYNHAYNLLKWSVFVTGYENIDGLNVMHFKIHSEHEDNTLYYCAIGTDDRILTRNSNIKVYCSCPDFAYTFAYVLYKHDSLLFPYEFPIEFRTIPPRKRNPQQIPFVCKHLYTIIQFCLHNKFEFSLNEANKYNRRNKIIRPIFEVTFRFYKYLESLKKRLKR